ncbi:MAG: Holliday junction branch migration protein RuvA [Campylobacterales bacterium]
MIGALRGVIFEKWGGELLIDVNGVIYRVAVPAKTHRREGEILLYIFEAVREGEVTLYGFESREELELFRRIIRVGGVGAKTALGLLSLYTPSQLGKIFREKRVEELKKVPGIGLKTARKILAEIGEEVEILLPVPGKGPEQEAHRLAMEGLIRLGFSREEAQRAVEGLEGEPEEILKEGLKRLASR